MDLAEYVAKELRLIEMERERLSARVDRAATSTPNSSRPKESAATIAGITEQLERNEPGAEIGHAMSLATVDSLSPIKKPTADSKETKEQQQQRSRSLSNAAVGEQKRNCKQTRRTTTDFPLRENRLPHKKQDDMDQWVTDTFFSYFPGYNNENERRQRELRERLQENRENFLKHQLKAEENLKKYRQKPKEQQPEEQKKMTENKSYEIDGSHNVTTTPNNRTHNASFNDKTDLEIIVTNPNYVPPKYYARDDVQPQTRPGTTREKLLRDLSHTEISNIVIGDGIDERNKRTAERENKQKKELESELRQQIEEKRLAAEQRREKERRDEEAIAKRLEAQLAAMRLTEQQEYERMRREKTRLQAEQQRVLLRAQLVAELEADAQQAGQRQSKADEEQSTTTSKNNNNVYKYFSNSARHEYRRGKPMPAAVEQDVSTPQMTKIERECFHLCEKICPFCNEPLKSYESCCLRCQRKLALKLHDCCDDSGTVADNESRNDCTSPADNYALVCLKCERLYSLCATCIDQQDVCRACHNKRNVCMNCRRTLCTFCLEEVACGRDAERTHINELPEQSTQTGFQLLDVQYGADNTYNLSQNDISQSNTSPNKSLNRSAVDELPAVADSVPDDKLTSEFIARYLSNYGDVALSRKLRSRSRSTQTTPETCGRRDIVLQESSAHNLTIPLLRDMPKMTRKSLATRALDFDDANRSHKRRQMANIAKRWEVPAVQRTRISSRSPRVITQTGSITKRLQEHSIYDEYERDISSEREQ